MPWLLFVCVPCAVLASPVSSKFSAVQISAADHQLHLQVGFAVAVVAEIVTPQQGLFGAWEGQDASLFAATALLLVSASAVLATMSKRRLGLQFKEAVITSMTALSRSRGSLTNRTVDSAVDYVFDVVFDKDMVFRDLIQDEFL